MLPRRPPQGGDVVIRGVMREPERSVLTMSEADIVAEEARTRGTLALFERDAGRRLDAKTARQIARLHFRLWSFGLRKSAIDDTRVAYEQALAFPANRDDPALFHECALVYLSYGAYDGAVDLLNRIVEEFPRAENIAAVVQLRCSIWTRLGDVVAATKCLR